MEFFTNQELVEALKTFEKNGGEFHTENHRYKSNNMMITCRNGLKAVSQFIADAQQTHRYRSIILDGLCAESLEETHFPRDTLIIGETIFDCLQWQEALNWTKQVKCVTKKNQILTETPITIITKKLLNNHQFNNVYYRIFVPHGFKHRIKCMYSYSLTDYCLTPNQFVFHEPYGNRHVTYLETRMLPLGYVKNREDDFYCSICLEMHIKMYQIKPCRHTMCFTCFEYAHFNRCDFNRCHLCRGSVLNMSVIYDETKTNSSPDVTQVLSSLKHLGGMIFSTYMAKPKDTFEKVYLRYLKDTSCLHFCNWPKNYVTRFYGKQLVNLIFIINAEENLPDISIIDGLCANDVNIYVLYTCSSQREKWEKILNV